MFCCIAPIRRQRPRLDDVSVENNLGRCVETAEHALHRFHTLNVRVRLMIPATLSFRRSESPPRELIARSCAAEVDQGRQRLLMLQRRGSDAMTLED